MRNTTSDPEELLLACGIWYGPIVMDTQEELKIAFEGEYQNGTFIKGKTNEPKKGEGRWEKKYQRGRKL